MLNINDFYGQEVKQLVKDFSFTINLSNSFSIVIHPPFKMKDGKNIDELNKKRLQKIFEKNKIVSFLFENNLEILVDINDENIRGPEIFFFSSSKSEIIVRSDDLEEFVDML